MCERKDDTGAQGQTATASVDIGEVKRGTREEPPVKPHHGDAAAYLMMAEVR